MWVSQLSVRGKDPLLCIHLTLKWNLSLLFVSPLTQEAHVHQLGSFVDAQHDYFVAAAELTGNLASELRRWAADQ
jgi:hypothetical protein